ncbi:MAG: ImmA/IrrE family metallo-endopeptidase [Sporolactobacillus sp.]
MFYCKTELEDYVEKIYHIMRISDPDSLNAKNIADILHIKLTISNTLTKAIRGSLQYFININVSIPSNKRWESFGHELHHVLRDTGNQNYLPFPLKELHERSADNFALQFCIPTFMLDQLRWPESNAALYVANKFRVTLPFARQRLDLYEDKLLQYRQDEYEMLVREPPTAKYDLSECTDETQRIMQKLKNQLEKKGEKFEIKSLL